MTEKNTELKGQESSQTLSDDQIVTERGISRRSFLTAGGALLAGAVALASALPALAQDSTATTGKKRKPMAKKTVKKTTKTVTKQKTVKKPAKKEQRSDPDSHRR